MCVARGKKWRDNISFDRHIPPRYRVRFSLGADCGKHQAKGYQIVHSR